MNNMDRLERIASSLPEAERVDIAEWGDHPTFRVRGRNFVFCDVDARMGRPDRPAGRHRLVAPKSLGRGRSGPAAR